MTLLLDEECGKAAYYVWAIHAQKFAPGRQPDWEDLTEEQRRYFKAMSNAVLKRRSEIIKELRNEEFSLSRRDASLELAAHKNG